MLISTFTKINKTKTIDDIQNTRPFTPTIGPNKKPIPHQQKLQNGENYRHNKRGKREFPLGSVWLIETSWPISLRMQNAFECTLGIIKAAFVGAFREFQCNERLERSTDHVMHSGLSQFRSHNRFLRVVWPYDGPSLIDTRAEMHAWAMSSPFLKWRFQCAMSISVCKSNVFRCDVALVYTSIGGLVLIRDIVMRRGKLQCCKIN